MLQLSSLALFFSGIALFLYQILWFRLLGFSENSETATILMAFFSGLALGSLLAQWRLRKGDHGLKGFIFSQILVAISAVLLLPILISPEQIIALSPSQQIASWDGFITVFVIALIPSMAMGMAFPFLTAWFTHHQPQKTPPLPYLYGLLTLGAFGAILSGGFYILPNVGLTGAIYSAAGLNLMAAFMAYLAFLKTLSKTAFKKSPPPVTTELVNTPWQSASLLIVLTTISFIWMGSEIIWSKYISLYAGSTLFSFSVIMAITLAGVAIGAFFIHHRQSTIKLTHKHLLMLLIVLFLTFNLTRLLLSYAPQIYNESYYLGELLNHSDSVWFALMIFIPNIVFGAIISLTLSLYGRNANNIKQNIGLAYALYLLASITGAIVTALWLIPNIGSHNTLFIFAIIPLLLGLLLTLLHLPNKVHLKNNLPGYAIITSLAVGAFFLPPLSFQEVFKQHYYRYINTEAPVIDLRLYEEPSGIVGLTLYKRESLHLQINGLTQSSVHIRHPHKGDINESLTALLPVLLQENATDALVLGFRAGIITRVLADSDLEGVVTTVEPEPKIVESMMVLNLLVNFPFLDDGRVDIEYNDFRDTLRNDNEHYSIIAAQAPYVWLTGSTRLYSQEFFNLVKSRLKPDGIFGYHLNLLRVDTQSLQSILHTFYSVFPNGAAFGDLSMGALVLLGSNQPLVMDLERTTTYFNEQEKAMETLRFGDLRHAKELPRYFLFSSETAKQIVGDAKLITDANLLIETRIKTLSNTLPQGEEDPYQLINQYVRKKRIRL